LISFLVIIFYSFSVTITGGDISEPFSFAADTIPAPRDTIPSVPDTIPAPPDTIPALPDTIPAIQDTVDNDTIPQPPGFPGMEPLEPEEEEEELRIVPTWPADRMPGYRVAESDSTIRWFMALDWTDRLYRKPGVITYRTGRLGNPSGIDIYSYENRHQNLVINEMSATDPVTGQVNWNRLPIHKIESIQVDNRAYTHQANVNLREYYVVQPRTFLNFDEGKDNYRNLEFSFTHNFTPETNLELSFWDRRDGDLYPRNDLNGRQIIGKIRHNLSETILIRAGYIDNGIEQQQPFGYNIPSLPGYDFNPYIAMALENSANSEHKTSDAYIQIFQRSGNDEPPGRAAGINYQHDNWDLTYSQDTTAYAIRDVSAFAWQDLRVGNTVLRSRAEVNAMRDNSNVSLTRRTWIGWRASLKSEIPLFSGLRIGVQGNYQGRNDGFTGYDVSGNLLLQPFSWLELQGFGGFGSSIPDIQSLYWNSNEFSGNEFLGNESALFGGGTFTLNPGGRLSAGVRGDARNVLDGIFLNREGSFTNIGPYINLSGSAWIELDSERFEGHISATGQTFYSESGHPVNQTLDRSGERLWLKGSIHWKNYVFNRAAFVKAGVSGMFSPGNYMAADYYVPLNRWQHGTGERYLPDFHRLDVDISARVRWIMLLIRWENVLDRITQLGYFETDGYPMPRNRFILGLRIVFTN
jgi:hypothetical protein